jgi:prolyl-tRNA synthetase
MSSKNAITPIRTENFSEWYQEVIKAADLAEHSVVRGCMVIKPWGYAIWERIQAVLDKKIKETGHENVCFPLLIPLSFFQKEAQHVEGFAKECAVVTHYRLATNSEGELAPDPEAKLTEPYVIRPTSETVIGDAMASWMQSYKDLPIKINQWANIMRWEMRTRLFLRTSEFLWQEGHTAHATREEAIEETLTMLHVYEQLAVDYLAIPVIKGEKTPGERFPGATSTYTIEAMMQDGKALQSGTSHFLGQNFSRAHGMKFMDKDQKEAFAWTSSWGASTRLIGALILTHSDDDGLVLPPRIAATQIIIIPVAMNDEDMVTVLEYCDTLAKDLRKQNYYEESIRVSVDKKDMRAGAKFWNAVKKGYPIRVEVGMREIAADTLSVSRRDKAPKDKQVMTRSNLLRDIDEILDDIHHQLLKRAIQYRDDKTMEISSLSELEKMFSQDETQMSGFALGYFDISIENTPAVEDVLKKMKLTIRCIPLGQENNVEGSCIFSGNKVKTKVIISRAY